MKSQIEKKKKKKEGWWDCGIINTNIFPEKASHEEIKTFWENRLQEGCSKLED